MREGVENLLRECLARLPMNTRWQLASVEKELLGAAAVLDREKPDDPKTTLYELIVQQTLDRPNATEVMELQDIATLRLGRRPKRTD